jgi:hypothetical protein
MYDDEDDDWYDDDEDLQDDDLYDDDELEMVICPECRAEIYEEAEQCPECGAYVIHSSHPFDNWHPAWLALGLLGILTLICMLLLSQLFFVWF